MSAVVSDFFSFWFTKSQSTTLNDWAVQDNRDKSKSLQVSTIPNNWTVHHSRGKSKRMQVTTYTTLNNWKVKITEVKLKVKVYKLVQY